MTILHLLYKQYNDHEEIFVFNDLFIEHGIIASEWYRQSIHKLIVQDVYHIKNLSKREMVAYLLHVLKLMSISQSDHIHNHILQYIIFLFMFLATSLLIFYVILNIMLTEAPIFSAQT